MRPAPPPRAPLALNGGGAVVPVSVPALPPTTSPTFPPLPAEQDASQTAWTNLFNEFVCTPTTTARVVTNNNFGSAPLTPPTPATPFDPVQDYSLSKSRLPTPSSSHLSLDVLLDFDTHNGAPFSIDNNKTTTTTPVTPLNTPMSNNSYPTNLVDVFDSVDWAAFLASTDNEASLAMDDCLFNDTTTTAENNELLNAVMFDTTETFVQPPTSSSSSVVDSNLSLESLVPDLGPIDLATWEWPKWESNDLPTAPAPKPSQPTSTAPLSPPSTPALPTDALTPIPINSPAPTPTGRPKKLFKCPLCPHTQARAYNMKKHIETHQQDRAKKFACGVCGRGYLRSYELARHQKRKEH
ncbi:hypothetical protein HDV05_008173 [Chytridiales sp. JEL 0842]|nr:hypothetical protein HDV05_008173 [Chytridiales sp. JEL 0842]